MINELSLPNSVLEKFTSKEKIEYFKRLKEYCLNEKKIKNKNIAHERITRIYSLLRAYEYEILGEENIPDNGKALFMCNHSNSHDFFTAHEVFKKKLGSNVSVFAASDDLDLATRLLFKSCKAALIDREDKISIQNGVHEFCLNLLSGVPGLMFGEATWNLHPIKPMQQIKIGGTKIAAITDFPIIPTIFEYVETPNICTKESELYTKCIVKFGKPLQIKKEKSLIEQTRTLQCTLEEERKEIWNSLGINKKSIQEIDKYLYLNHTYLKKFKAFGFTYDSESEAKYLFSRENELVENEFCLDENGNLIPGITTKETGKKYIKI